MARTTQRDVMRDLHRRFNGDHDKVVAAYAAAERRGDVTRAASVLGAEPEEYARRTGGHKSDAASVKSD
jgi:soluble lytic murein transglycosylase-like protein